MAIRNHDDDYRWVFERNLRLRRNLPLEDDSPKPKLSDTLIELATVVVGFVGIILLIDAVITALN